MPLHFRHVGVRMNRDDILARAANLISGDRQEQHGEWEDNARLISGLWAAYLDGQPVKPRDVAPMMALLKIARQRYSPSDDNVVDACGYLALGGELDSSK